MFLKFEKNIQKKDKIVEFLQNEKKLSEKIIENMKTNLNLSVVEIQKFKDILKIKEE